MKKLIYIILFSFLGLLLGFLVHSAVEIWVIKLLVENFKKYNLGLSMDDWFFLHRVWGVVALGGGVWFGFSQGKYWWGIVYKNK